MRLADLRMKYLIEPAMAVCECADACGILHVLHQRVKTYMINVEHHLQYILVTVLFFFCRHSDVAYTLQQLTQYISTPVLSFLLYG